MKLISHRGNIDQVDRQKENTRKYIENAIQLGYDVELDLRFIENQLFLGHDDPTEEIDFKWLYKNKEYLWIHCKNIDALTLLKDHLNCFYHTKEDYVLTSKGNIWSYSGVKLYPGIIAALPENQNYSLDELYECYAICSDLIKNYK
jgi:hypothetical protein